MAYDRELQRALEAAELAGQHVLRMYEAFTPIPNAPSNITTEADHQAQEIILGHLRGAFPDDAYCAEEATALLAGAKREGRRIWIVDPIDGTRGFARKNGEFSLMIGFVEDGQIGAGVVAQPVADRLTYAAQGGGCWRRDGRGSPVRCQVTAVAELRAATLTQSRSKNPAVPTRHVQAIGPARVVETYSAGIKLALVARGEADLYVNDYDQFHDWDICAGHLLVTEAGGQVTGLAGQTLHYGLPGAWQRHGLVATNGRLHDAAVAAFQRSSVS